MIAKNDLRFFLENFQLRYFDSIVACDDADDTVSLVEEYLEILEEEGEVGPDDIAVEDE